MRSLTVARSPLLVVHATIQLCTLASTALLLALVFALLNPAWSSAACGVRFAVLAPRVRADEGA